MVGKPDIRVSIVHIEGPLKGRIQELSDSEIFIGRNPGSQVLFPADCLTISRDHARIVREGNRFKLVNKSANYTYVNGKPVKENEEAFLKSGDWLMFAEGGPKASFLMKTAEAGQSRDIPAGPGPVPEEKTPEKPPPENKIAGKKASESRFSDSGPPKDNINGRRYGQHPPDTPLSGPSSSPKPPSEPESAQSVPLVIRYGPTLQRFKQLPVTIGTSTECDFPMDHAALSGRHAEIFYRQGQYWIKDLTLTQSVFLDGRTIGSEAPLAPESRLDLTHQGPAFLFLGEGRLDEIME